jgi:2-keto-4-pentenoate hydratase/2-oxohepta-3-ene-1,7-dioic acid hydratase in catechol pathway
MPRGSQKADWELKLSVIIHRAALYIKKVDAMGHLASYCVVSDIHERTFHFEKSGHRVKDNIDNAFGSIRPWRVTGKGVADPQNPVMWLEVNGRRFPRWSTRTLIVVAAQLVSYVSQFMSEQPGEIISTGTPPSAGIDLCVGTLKDSVNSGTESLLRNRQLT